MASISETCSVCSGTFDVQFRYQMEERDGGFSFYCSQKCLEKSQQGGAGELVTCDACSKRFAPELVSQVLYVSGKRRHACSLPCRNQILREARGARLGELAAEPEVIAAPVDVAPIAAPAPRVEAQAATAVPIDVGRDSASAGRSITPVPASKPSFSASPASAPSSQGPKRHSSSSSIRAAGPPSSKVDSGVPRLLAVFNHKGGTGKTTSAVSVAAGLAQKGKRVLLVDTDSQGNVAVSLGAKVERSLYHVLVMGLRVDQAVTSVRPNLDLLPSNETLAAAELYLAGRQNRDRVLSDRLSSAASSYDFVILDCSPSLSLMNQNALVFADSVLVPVACDYLSLVGVRQVIKTVKNVNALLHHPVQIWGVLPTFYDARAKICREAVATLKSHFGDRCLAPVRAAIKVKEAPAQGQTIFEYAEGTHAAEDYAAVIDTILASRARGRNDAATPEPQSGKANAASASASA